MFSLKINFFQSFNKTFEDFIHKKPPNLDFKPRDREATPKRKKIKVLSGRAGWTHCPKSRAGSGPKRPET
jgi:hypothetical protein